MVADADGETLPRCAEYGERTIVRLQELASGFEEGCAPGRELHVTRRPLDQPAAEPLFQPLQL
jgi:hypothetical protein